MKKYQIIYADPPWLYEGSKSSKRTGLAKTIYNCMSVEDIKTLPVSKLSDKNCILFMWATFPKLEEALSVIKAWGFTYRTVAFVWAKTNPTGSVEKINKDLLIKKGLYCGLGYWTRSNAEVVLLAKKGSIKRIIKNIKQIIIAPRGKHSAKPPEIRDKITQLVGGLPRIELFARGSEKIEDGWVKVGNDITGEDIRVSLDKVIKGTYLLDTLAIK